MLKNDNHYYIVSQNTSENKYLFEVKNHPQRLCNKPTEVYSTTYDSMYVAIHYGGFDIKTTKNQRTGTSSFTVSEQRLPIETWKPLRL